MAIHLKRLEIIKKRMNHILSENTGKPIEVVTADCERDNFMSADEAVSYGIIDKVITRSDETIGWHNQAGRGVKRSKAPGFCPS